jgi:DNA replication protein DnaC
VHRDLTGIDWAETPLPKADIETLATAAFMETAQNLILIGGTGTGKTHVALWFARRPADRSTRPQRWHDAVAELIALQAEYVAWAEALPDTLQETATADALQAIADVDLDELATIKPPRGYGRD